MSAEELVVMMEGRQAGSLLQDRNGRLTLKYDSSYREDPAATPLSTALPLTAGTHQHRGVTAYLWGLLPENADVLERWAREFGVRSGNPFVLLKNVGEDVAGAAQFIRPDRLDSVEPGDIEWLSEKQVAARIRALQEDPSAWLPELAQGRFSLAGAQAKFALLKSGRRWGQPSGALPTTHIIKPTTGHYADQDIAEHLTMRTAALAGLRVAQSRIQVFDGEHAVVVERFDRVEVDGGWLRVHQEDFCQALGLLPAAKYDVGALDLANVLRTVGDDSDADLGRLLDALAFNWLIGGTDAHAKNYALLLAGRQARLAPLYDLTSILPYVASRPGPAPVGQVTPNGLQMAMKLGKAKGFSEVTLGDWADVARAMGLDQEQALARVHELADRIVDAVTETLDEAPPVVAASPVAAQFLERVKRHLRRCQSALQGRPARPRRRG